MGELSMHWASDAKNTKHTRPVMTDEKLELLGRRFQANNICFLLDITFESYLLAHHGWDRIAKHLNEGGGCRVLKGTLVINEPREGLCAWCERWWNKRSGGLNKSDLCPECARNMHSPLPGKSEVKHA